MEYALTARQIIQREYGRSRNMMTDSVLTVRKLSRNVAYELSTGEGFEGSRLYGVSVAAIRPDGTSHRGYRTSRCFHDLRSAQEWIADLKYMLLRMAAWGNAEAGRL